MPAPRNRSQKSGAKEKTVVESSFASFETVAPHPGEHLRLDFLPEYGLTAGSLARAMGLKDRTRIERVIRGMQPITADTALRLAAVFGTSASFWLNLQATHDLSKAAIASREELAAILPLQIA
jgi:addiction module HigA family antidote